MMAGVRLFGRSLLTGHRCRRSEWKRFQFSFVTSFSTSTETRRAHSSDKPVGLMPLIAAVDEGDTGSIGEMLTAAAAGRFKLDGVDSRGDNVFHHVARTSNERIIQLFGELDEKVIGSSLDGVNGDGKTPFQQAVDDNKLVCAVGLLAVGSDPDSALRYAIDTGNVDVAKMAIAFGAKVNHVYKGNKLLKIAQQSQHSNSVDILQLLHRVGASLEDQIIPVSRDLSRLTRDLKSPDVDHNNGLRSSRVLCLDGGGIRGLVLIQLLMAIEKEAGKPILNCFDFISGTSTGGILALAIMTGKSLRYCRSTYMRLKDEVFHRGPPYNPTELETFLKKVFGEKTAMSEYPHPRVMVTSVLADRWPTQLHLFRNYDRPGVQREGDDDNQLQQPWTEQLVWMAARSTSAAPFYFPLFDNKFLDGGVIANNPTIDTLTEIQQLSEATAVAGTASSSFLYVITDSDGKSRYLICTQTQDYPTQSTKVVVSLGTGHYKSEEFKGCSVYRWRHPGDLLRDVIGVVDIMKVFAQQSLSADGRVVERAAAWCSSLGLPYFRLNPLLPEHVQLNCTDNVKLVNMLFETQCYIYDNRHSISSIVSHL